jgi:hypothetical protein
MSKVSMISAEAKKIRKQGEKWVEAIKRATIKLKKEKKI